MGWNFIQFSTYEQFVTWKNHSRKAAAGAVTVLGSRVFSAGEA